MQPILQQEHDCLGGIEFTPILYHQNKKGLSWLTKIQSAGGYNTCEALEKTGKRSDMKPSVQMGEGNYRKMV